MAKKDDKERLIKKRQNYLESAMLVNRLLDVRIFPSVVDALTKQDKGQASFNKICKNLEIPDGMVDSLWKTLLDVNNRMSQEPGWIPGT